jgi:uncharacterized protein
MRVAQLYRHPVKGLTPEPLQSAKLVEGAHFPCDRLFALENGPSGFDPEAPTHQPKIKFLMLMRNGKLAALTTRYDEATKTLTIRLRGELVAQGRLDRREGQAEIENYLTAFLGDEIRGPVRLLAAPEGHRFMDSKSGFVSLINLASVEAIAEAAGKAVDALRFRANIHLVDMAPWAEAELVGKTLTLGGARLEVLKMIDRCAATGVDPATGDRDMDVVDILRKRFGHIDCGVYARVLEGGEITIGDVARV